MGNRADRRIGMKLARQAIRRARTPLETGILKAAVQYMSADPFDGLGALLERPDFDASWLRLMPDLRDILDERYGDFVAAAYVEASSGIALVRGGEEARTMRLFLCPISGKADRLRAFASDEAARARLAGSLLESGVVEEGVDCFLAPVLLPFWAFLPSQVGPARVRALLAWITQAAAVGTADEGDFARLDLSEIKERSGEETMIAALVGLERLPIEKMFEEEEGEAGRLAIVAQVASWRDAYADGLDGIALEAPLDWPATAATLGWEMVRVPMEAALREAGRPGIPVDTLHCGVDALKAHFVLAATSGGTTVGPFKVPSELAWSDIEAFYGRLGAAARELREHATDRPVLAALA